MDLASILKTVPPVSWQNLAQKRIYIGHQSVGYNIVEGIKEIALEYSFVQLNIVEGDSAVLFDAPVFAHSKAGKNQDPRSKIQALSRLMTQGVGEKIDVVLLKFCYIDINQGSDVAGIFADYKKTILDLGRRFPQNRFVPVTVPLRVVQTGIKVPIKRLIGRPIGGYSDNVARSHFNNLVRREFAGKVPVFDLAKAEATDSHGNVFQFTIDGEFFEALYPAFTHDGGHLNEYGRKIIAARLLTFLASLS